MRKKSVQPLTQDERGIALLLTVFVIALATLLVMDFGRRARYDQRASRAFVEEIQARYILKSGMNLGRALLEIPKTPGRDGSIEGDWLGEPWALIAGMPLPISGFSGDLKISIYDEDGKIDLNAVAAMQPTGSPFQPPGGSGAVNPTNPAAGGDESLFWKNVLRELFVREGFEREQYPPDEHRTKGNIGFAAGDQVAALTDWVDPDTESFTNAGFDGKGMESGAPPGEFYNRPLRTLSELLLVPGISLERAARIAPFVKVSSYGSMGAKRINVNTAPFEVLAALNFPENQLVELVNQRSSSPINQQILSAAVAGDMYLGSHTKLTSSEFSIYCRAVMPSSTHWLKAIVASQGTVRRFTQIRSIEFY